MRFEPARAGSGREKTAWGKPRRRLEFRKGDDDLGSREPLLFELRKQFADFAVQVFAWLKFHDRTGWNFHFHFRFAGIPTDFRLRALDEEGPKIAQHNFLVFGKMGGDSVDESLNDFLDLTLREIRLVADFDHKVAFGD